MIRCLRKEKNHVSVVCIYSLKFFVVLWSVFCMVYRRRKISCMNMVVCQWTSTSSFIFFCFPDAHTFHTPISPPYLQFSFKTRCIISRPLSGFWLRSFLTAFISNARLSFFHAFSYISGLCEALCFPRLMAFAFFSMAWHGSWLFCGFGFGSFFIASLALSWWRAALA